LFGKALALVAAAALGHGRQLDIDRMQAGEGGALITTI
jgi:hypothetical protein